MSTLASSTRRWTVSTRTTGETLVARCDDAEISVVVFGLDPLAATDQERLRDLVRAARAAAEHEPAPAPIPSLLHHALARAMTLCIGKDARRGAVILFDNGQHLAAGVVGEIDIQVRLDERPAQLPWVRLRDRAGHEGRAFLFPVGRRVQLVASWPAGRAEHGAGAVLEARSTFGAGHEPGLSSPPANAVLGSAAADLGAAAHDPDTKRFLQWLDHMAQRDPDPAPPAVEAPKLDAPSLRPPHLEAPKLEAPRLEPPKLEAPRLEPPKPDLHRPAAPQGIQSPGESSTARPRPPSLADQHPAPAILATRGEPGAMDPGAFRPEAFQQAPARAGAPEREVGVRREPELHVSPARAANESERPAIGPERAAAMGDASSAKPAADPSAGARDPSAAPAARPKSLQLVPPRRPAWPPRERPTASRWKPLALGAALVVVLGGAWLVAGRSKPGAHRGFALPAFGPRFTVTVNSQPAGASIAADGKPSGLITPATLELPAGDHELTLSLAGKGSATYKVSGERDERTSLEALMYGGLKITAADANLPVSVTLDGLDRGYAPLSVEDLLPGPHEIRFRAPGVDPWTETFELKVGETHEVVARPFTMPETGMIDVHATVAGGDGVVPLKGAAIFVDGEPRGVTPASIELARGPHSIRVAYRGEEAPVQVIDLPGGNHRIADFAFGTDFQPPSFVQIAPEGPVARARPTVVSAAITDMGEADLREMWLHVRDPEGAWRRYEMTLLRAPDGIVGVALFPVALLGPDGAATYYVSALTQEGDEYYTELRTPHARGSRAPRAKGHPPPPPATVPSTP